VERSASARRNELSLNKMKSEIVILITAFWVLAAACLIAAKRFGVAKYLLLLCGAFILTGCLSFTTTERPAPVSTVTRTETVYVTENGTRVRRIVTVDPGGRRYYVEGGRTIYVDHYDYY
jgi:predicted membrane metal-binding protein